MQVHDKIAAVEQGGIYVKKVVAAMLSFALVLPCALPAMASSPALPKMLCRDCFTWFSYKVTREYQHDERFDCRHGHPGAKDTYAVYEVREYGVCPNCKLVYSYTYEDHVLIKCTGA